MDITKLSSQLKSMGGMSFRVKAIIVGVILLIISLIFLILFGRVLDDTIKSGQKDSNPHIHDAWRLSKYTVIAFVVVGVIGLFLVIGVGASYAFLPPVP